MSYSSPEGYQSCTNLPFSVNVSIGCCLSERGPLSLRQPHHAQHVPPWERGTEEWHALTLNRLLAGRVRREWWRFRCRDGCHVRAHAR